MDHRLRERFQRHWMMIATTCHVPRLEAQLTEFARDLAEAEARGANETDAEVAEAWADREWAASALIEGVKFRMAHLAGQGHPEPKGVGQPGRMVTEGERTGSTLADPHRRRRDVADCDSDAESSAVRSVTRGDNDRGNVEPRRAVPRYPKGTLLGRHLAEYRRGMEMTFREAADHLGVPHGSLCKAEHKPEHALSERIARALRPFLPPGD